MAASLGAGPGGQKSLSSGDKEIKGGGTEELIRRLQVVVVLGELQAKEALSVPGHPLLTSRPTGSGGGSHKPAHRLCTLSSSMASGTDPVACCMLPSCRWA